MSDIELVHWLGRVSGCAEYSEFAVAVSTAVGAELGPRHQLIITQGEDQVTVGAKQSAWLLRLLLDGVRAVEVLDPTIDSRSWMIESARAKDVRQAAAYGLIASVERDQRAVEVREKLAAWIEACGSTCNPDSFRDWWSTERLLDAL